MCRVEHGILQVTRNFRIHALHGLIILSPAQNFKICTDVKMRNLSLARNSKRKATANLSACELELHFEVLHKICLKFYSHKPCIHKVFSKFRLKSVFKSYIYLKFQRLLKRMLEELNKDGYKINGTKLQYLIAKNEMIRKIL